MATQVEVGTELEQHRGELTAYCYRMLGSPFEAEDAVQETLHPRLARLRPLRGARGAPLVALPDRDERLPRHARAAASGARGRWTSARRASRSLENLNILPEVTWLEPMPDAPVGRRRPADVAVARETIRLAFVAALQHLPPRQRAALILCEVLRWKATEVAELLETSVASVNSALQRARATLEATRARRAADADRRGRPRAARPLRRRVRALRHGRADRADPRGRDAVDAAVRPLAAAAATTSSRGGSGPGIGCQGSRVDPDRRRERLAGVRRSTSRARRRRLRAVGAAGARDRRTARIGELTFFLDTETLFPLFGLPLRFDA